MLPDVSSLAVSNFPSMLLPVMLQPCPDVPPGSHLPGHVRHVPCCASVPVARVRKRWLQGFYWLWLKKSGARMDVTKASTAGSRYTGSRGLQHTGARPSPPCAHKSRQLAAQASSGAKETDHAHAGAVKSELQHASPLTARKTRHASAAFEDLTVNNAQASISGAPAVPQSLPGVVVSMEGDGGSSSTRSHRGSIATSLAPPLLGARAPTVATKPLGTVRQAAIPAALS